VARLAEPEDTPRVAAILARAFADHPWTNWVVAADRRHQRLVDLYTLYLEAGVTETWVTDDCLAAAVWIPPGSFEGPGGDEVAAALGDRQGHAAQVTAMVEERRPEEPHWMLALMGTHPDHRGRGLGSEVLKPGLERPAPAYLDTATEAGVQFAERHGFNVFDEIDVPSGGPHVWLMWRDPAR
jgi:GNAT superfamily N-acetyltransferase